MLLKEELRGASGCAFVRPKSLRDQSSFMERHCRRIASECPSSLVV